MKKKLIESFFSHQSLDLDPDKDSPKSLDLDPDKDSPKGPGSGSGFNEYGFETLGAERRVTENELY
jgi:hypothetical protein